MKKVAITTAALGLAAFMAIGLAGISPAWADNNDNDYGYHKVKPVGLWHLNRAYQEVLGTPPDLTPDNSCNNNDGEFVGDAGLLAGKFKNGLVLDGDGDYVEIADSDALDPSENLTISAWVKTSDTDTNTHAAVVSKFDAAKSGGPAGLAPGYLLARIIHGAAFNGW